jgi:hypothetical protein
MKTLYVLTIALFGLCQVNKSQILIKNTFSPTKVDFKTLYVKGNTFKFDFDTLYYVNRLFIEDYHNTIDTVNFLRDLALECFNKRREFNMDTKDAITDLTSNMSTGFQLVRDSLALNNLRLDKWKAENAKLISINSQITSDLNEAKDQIRKEKWNSTGNKMLFGVGGVIIGAGLSTLIIIAAK